MTEQLRVQMTEQRAHDKAQRQEMDAQRQTYEAKLDAQRQDYEAKLDAQRQDCEEKLDAQRQDYEAKLDMQRQAYEKQLDALRQGSEAKLDAQRQDANTCVLDAKLHGLQERFDALHQAKLLSDDEMFALEDKLADFIKCRSSVMAAPGDIDAAAESVRMLVGMCERLLKDGMLARQLRRML